MFTDRTFGVEIEGFNLSYSAVKDIVNSLGYKILSTDCNYSVWNIKSDCTIQPYEEEEYSQNLRGSNGNPFELTTPILSGDKGITEFVEVYNALLSNDLRINNSCGLHVHVGAGDITKEIAFNLMMRYDKYQDQIMTLIAPKRNEALGRMLKFDRYIRHNGIDRIKRYFNEGAYPGRYNLNLGTIPYKGTVEFREFGGILDTECLVNWIKFCVNFIDVTKKLTENPDMIDESMYMELDSDIVDYFDQRAEFLSYNTNAR